MADKNKKEKKKEKKKKEIVVKYTYNPNGKTLKECIEAIINSR